MSLTLIGLNKLVRKVTLKKNQAKASSLDHTQFAIIKLQSITIHNNCGFVVAIYLVLAGQLMLRAAAAAGGGESGEIRDFLCLSKATKKTCIYIQFKQRPLTHLDIPTTVLTFLIITLFSFHMVAAVNITRMKSSLLCKVQ